MSLTGGGHTTHSAITCAQWFLGMCLVAPDTHDGGVFGFAEFVQGFGLLALIYTVSEVRYRFRVQAAAWNLYRFTFWLAGLIGVGTLVIDVWFAQGYLLPSFLSARVVWQAAFGFLYLILVLVWLWAVFVKPTAFDRFNRVNYARTLYFYLLQGAESDLPIIAAELARSASSIIKYASESYPRGPASRMDVTASVANDILLLIATRKFCRHIVASAPGTAIAFFNAMSKQKKYHVPIGQFASNITTEALLNKDSILYHEDDGFHSGYFGYVRPFTKAIYGDFNLIEATRPNSPLDIDLKVRWKFDGDQLAAYARAVLTTFESALGAGHFYIQSSALYRAFDVIEHACRDLHKLDETPENPASDDVQQRLQVVVSFINGAIELLEKRELQRTRLRRHDEPYKWRGDSYDEIANLMFEVIQQASWVKRRDFTGWHVQHNIVWNGFFGFHETKIRNIIRFKLRRRLYEEIRTIERFPNFANARILGYCLNVMGLTEGKKRDHTRGEYQLRKTVISWARRNYLWLAKQSPKAAEAVLLGAITFDAPTNRLVKTYPEGLRSEPPREYLELDAPTRPIVAMDG